MMRFLYNLLVCIGVIGSLPYLLWQYGFRRKYRDSLLAKLSLPKIVFSPYDKEKVIWIHSISLGETKAASLIFQELKKHSAKAKFVISTVTETGMAEAKRTMSGADLYFYHPLDLFFIMKRLVKQINPSVFIMVEGDFWYERLYQLKKHKCPIILVNGKISEKSALRFKRFKGFSKELFSMIDLLCLQSSSYAKRFEELGVDKPKMVITGNMKLDAKIEILSLEEKKKLKETLGIQPSDKVVVVGSTHAPEEETILDAFEGVWRVLPHTKVLLVPRHPERFIEVEKLLIDKKIPYLSYTKLASSRTNARVILIDTMGQLSRCYQMSDVAIVGGSFVDHVGGHNIFEPLQAGVPVIFGPFMSAQQELASLVIDAKAGIQTSAEKLGDVVLALLQDQLRHEELKSAGLRLCEEVRGSAQKTCSAIEPFLVLEEKS